MTTTHTSTTATGNQQADSSEQRRRLEMHLVEKIIGRSPALRPLVGDFNMGPKSPEDGNAHVLVITDGEPTLTPEGRERFVRMLKEMPPVDLTYIFLDIHGDPQWPAHCLPAKRDFDAYFEPEAETLHVKVIEADARPIDFSLLLGHPSGYVGYEGSHLDRLREMVRGQQPLRIWPLDPSGSMGAEDENDRSDK